MFARPVLAQTRCPAELNRQSFSASGPIVGWWNAQKDVRFPIVQDAATRCRIAVGVSDPGMCDVTDIRAAGNLNTSTHGDFDWMMTAQGEVIWTCADGRIVRLNH